MAKKANADDVVTCPLCSGDGHINKHMAVVRLRSPNFRELIHDFEDDFLTPKEDPFEKHQTDNTESDHLVTHRSWKE